MQAFFLTTREWENIGGTFLKNRVEYIIVYNEFGRIKRYFEEKGGHLYEQKINRTFG